MRILFLQTGWNVRSSEYCGRLLPDYSNTVIKYPRLWRRPRAENNFNEFSSDASGVGIDGNKFAGSRVEVLETRWKNVSLFAEPRENHGK
jgi:hypothetical protein